MLIYLKNMLAGRSLPSQKARISVDWKKLLFSIITLCCVPCASAMELTPQELNAQLIKAAKEGNGQEVERLFGMGADAKMIPYTSLPDVANLEILKLLMANGADINAIGGSLADQDTALITAINVGSSEKCKMLLDAGANPNLYRNRHPLIHAIEYKRPGFFNHSYQVLKMLLDAGADINACGRRGNAFVYAACFNGLLCELWIRDQKKVNDGLVTAVLCLNRMANDGDACARLLLKERKALLLPYLDTRKYLPLIKLLNAKDNKEMRAFDHYPVDWLNPDLLKKPVVKIAELVPEQVVPVVQMDAPAAADARSPYSDPSLAEWVALGHSSGSSWCSIQ